MKAILWYSSCFNRYNTWLYLDIAVSIVMLRREIRDYIRSKLSMLIFILLILSEEQLIKRRINRLHVIAEMQNITIEKLNNDISDDLYIRKLEMY